MSSRANHFKTTDVIELLHLRSEGTKNQKSWVICLTSQSHSYCSDRRRSRPRSWSQFEFVFSPKNRLHVGLLRLNQSEYQFTKKKIRNKLLFPVSQNYMAKTIYDLLILCSQTTSCLLQSQTHILSCPACSTYRENLSGQGPCFIMLVPQCLTLNIER